MKLIRQPSVGTLKLCREASVNFDNTHHVFIEGDNLEVLELLQKSYYRPGSPGCRNHSRRRHRFIGDLHENGKTIFLTTHLLCKSIEIWMGGYYDEYVRTTETGKREKVRYAFPRWSVSTGKGAAVIIQTQPVG